MRKQIFGIALCMLMGLPSVASGQMTKEMRKERQETKKLLNEKASKDAQKEAKKMEKEGWKTAPGALPMAKQLDRSYMMQYELDEDGFPKYIMAEAISVGGNYDAAKMQALELAKQNLAGQIQTEVAGMVESTVSNNQLDKGEAASITESVNASKSVISQSLGRIVPIVEVYKEDKKTRNRQVLVRIAYNQEMAKNAAKRAIKKDLEEKGNELHNKLDELFNW